MRSFHMLTNRRGGFVRSPKMESPTAVAFCIPLKPLLDEISPVTRLEHLILVKIVFKNVAFLSAAWTCRALRSWNPELQTLNPQSSTLNAQHSTLNTQHSTLNPQPSPDMSSPTAMTDIIWTRYDPKFGSKSEGSYQVQTWHMLDSHGQILAQIRQSRPDSCLGLGVKARKTLSCSNFARIWRARLPWKA